MDMRTEGEQILDALSAWLTLNELNELQKWKADLVKESFIAGWVASRQQLAEQTSGEPVAYRYRCWIMPDYEHEQGFWSKGFFYSSHIPSKHQDLQPLYISPPSVEVLLEALRKESPKLIKLAAQMAMKQNMPDVEHVTHSVNIPKKSWKSIHRMCIKSTQQCNEWSIELRGIFDALNAYSSKPQNPVSVNTDSDSN
jgi:hypothetical protein